MQVNLIYIVYFNLILRCVLIYCNDCFYLTFNFFYSYQPKTISQRQFELPGMKLNIILVCFETPLCYIAQETKTLFIFSD